MNQQVIDVITYLSNHWPQILGYSLNGLTVAVVLQWLKKKFELDVLPRFTFLKVIRLDGPRVVALLFTLFTGVSTAASWLTDPVNAKYIPERYAFLLVAGVYIHRFIVSPAATKLEVALQPYLEAVSQIKKEEQTPIVPATPAASALPPSLAPFTGDQAAKG